ncbi:hypothetical protein [Pseudonocardia endophytica]|uniref:Uncharacterized protein n=1 Tax=Pseudonocardia endophytica TaxID=401976 RepID=A0A4R1HGX7_PSEEN|nr:hypothetical protein [Pseudonocardia endophytica]TCK21437.1 hypothetical protein EV378_5423 [Pseudonocardia endophytica]
MTGLVHHEVEGGRATVARDSPSNRNALSAHLRAELVASLDVTIADPRSG